jgi:hypothetical protein
MFIISLGGLTDSAYAGQVIVLPQITMTCNTLTQTRGEIQATRDNTGAFAERFRIEVTDGNGALLGFAENDVPVGNSLLLNGGTFEFQPAAANPLRYRLYSPAGNGAPEESYLDITATVDDLESCAQNDSHLNQGHCDDRMYLYPASDFQGEPALHLYRAVSATQGALTAIITEAEIAPYTQQPPAEPVLLQEVSGFQVWVLETGELQINSAYDFEGKSCVLIFEGVRPTGFRHYFNRR